MTSQDLTPTLPGPSTAQLGAARALGAGLGVLVAPLASGILGSWSLVAGAVVLWLVVLRLRHDGAATARPTTLAGLTWGLVGWVATTLVLAVWLAVAIANGSALD